MISLITGITQPKNDRNDSKNSGHDSTSSSNWSFCLIFWVSTLFKQQVKIHAYAIETLLKLF